MMRNLAILTLLLGAMAAGSASAAPYLYAWASHAEHEKGAFLAVIDSDPASPSYGQVVATAPTGMTAGAAHHTEYEMPSGSTLFANDWGTGKTFVFDMSDRKRPRVAAHFDRAGDYIFPHSFARLPNGNVVATFQSVGKDYAPPGGLVELDNKGALVRGSGSATPDIPTAINWPYSLAVVPGTDHILTTSTDMGRGRDWKSPETSHVQLWSASTLKLRASIALPAGKDVATKVNIYPAEPRTLADGSVYVNTFTCGLYRIEGLDTAAPRATFVHAFPGGAGDHDMCAVPVVYGKYWIQTTGANNGLVVLDVSDPAKPREVSRLSLPERWHMPHWISADRKRGRIAVTGQYAGWLAMLKFDATTGSLSIDEDFGDQGGIVFDRADWPHKATGKTIVHGVVFAD